MQSSSPALCLLSKRATVSSRKQKGRMLYKLRVVKMCQLLKATSSIPFASSSPSDLSGVGGYGVPFQSAVVLYAWDVMVLSAVGRFGGLFG